MSAYSELIKNFERVRAYMRDFYVYGFKSRDGYDRKSKRSYDDEKRRMESWLGDHMGFVRSSGGKNVFISIDSRSAVHNPFYRAWKAKSFTDGDITLHFVLLDILYSADIALGVGEILDIMDREYLSFFREPMVFDESTVRKKLKEYCSEGLLECVKDGKRTLYRRAADIGFSEKSDALDFFSEAAPCGVIGSFILDKLEKHDSLFSFKHHYMTAAIDSGVLASLFDAMGKKSVITVVNHAGGTGEPRVNRIIPLRIFISVQSGRQYLAAYQPDFNCIKTFRVDYLSDVKICEPTARFDELRKMLSEKQKHMWGTQPGKYRDGKTLTEHVEFTVKIADDEDYIIKRLEREKRCGEIVKMDDNTYKFVADVYDTNEMLTWIRTFICRITELDFSNRTVENRFRDDLEEMYRIYGIDKEVSE